MKQPYQELQEQIDRLFTQLSIKRFDKQRHQRRLILLGYLSKHPEGVNPSQIADDLNMARSQLTRLIDGFEKLGLVTRRLCRNDKRRFEVFITEKGKDDFRYIKTADELLCLQLQAFLGSEDSAAALRLFTRLNDFADQVIPIDMVDSGYDPSEQSN